MESRFDKLVDMVSQSQNVNRRGYNFYGDRTDLGRPFCNKCKSVGHSAQGCRAKQIRGCYFCHEEGHVKANCPKRVTSSENINNFGCYSSPYNGPHTSPLPNTSPMASVAYNNTNPFVQSYQPNFPVYSQPQLTPQQQTFPLNYKDPSSNK